MAFLKGFGIGLGMVIFIGPVFFTLLQSTLQRGTWAGLMVAWGILISDVVVVALCSLGAIPFFKNPANQFWLAVGGGVLLLGMGVRYLIWPPQSVKGKLPLKSQQLAAFFIKGFLVNFVNPFVFLVWIGVIGMAQNSYGESWELVLFLAAALLGILTTDTLKVFLARKIQPLLKASVLTWVYRVVGICLIGFSLRLFWFGIQHPISF